MRFNKFMKLSSPPMVENGLFSSIFHVVLIVGGIYLMAKLESFFLI